MWASMQVSATYFPYFYNCIYLVVNKLINIQRCTISRRKSDLVLDSNYFYARVKNIKGQMGQRDSPIKEILMETTSRDRSSRW